MVYKLFNINILITVSVFSSLLHYIFLQVRTPSTTYGFLDLLFSVLFSSVRVIQTQIAMLR